MRRPEVELLDEDLDDTPTYAGSELGFPIDLTREELEGEDDLGFRALYEHPEAILRSGHWSRAA